jgi:hypothetical protein
MVTNARALQEALLPGGRNAEGELEMIVSRGFKIITKGSLGK